MAKLFTIKNLSTGKLDIGETVLNVGQSAEVDVPSDKVVAALAAAKASITLNTPAAFASLTNAPTIVNTTGTPVALVAKAATIAAITDVATAANAIATLVGVVNAQSVELRRMAGMIAAIATTQQQNLMVKQ
mgnify:CR=1 FL=1